jgi:hypothetical protein
MLKIESSSTHYPPEKNNTCGLKEGLNDLVLEAIDAV